MLLERCRKKGSAAGAAWSDAGSCSLPLELTAASCAWAGCGAVGRVGGFCVAGPARGRSRLPEVGLIGTRAAAAGALLVLLALGDKVRLFVAFGDAARLLGPITGLLVRLAPTPTLGTVVGLLERLRPGVLEPFADGAAPLCRRSGGPLSVDGLLERLALALFSASALRLTCGGRMPAVG